MGNVLTAKLLQSVKLCMYWGNPRLTLMYWGNPGCLNRKCEVKGDFRLYIQCWRACEWYAVVDVHLQV